MSIHKGARPPGQVHPTGVVVLHTPEGGAQRMTCPMHKLACTREETPKGVVWRCPRNHTLNSTKF